MSQTQSVLLQAVLYEEGYPHVCCRVVYCDNGVVLERSDFYQIKLSASILNSFVVLKSVTSKSGVKKVLHQKFV